jgi:hypothetical protein
MNCENCGAPVAIDDEALRRGYAVCTYCAATLQLTAPEGKGAEPVTAPPAPPPKKLTLAELNQPAERPAKTKLEIENEPGVRFFARLPAGGFTAPTFMGLLFAAGIIALLGWGEVRCWQAQQMALLALLLWGPNVLTILPRIRNARRGGINVFTPGKIVELSLRLIVPDASMLFLLEVFLLIWIGREEIRAEAGQFVYTTRVLFAQRKQVDWRRFSDARFKKADFDPLLYLLFDRAELAIALSASVPERRWLRTELLRFFAPLWEKTKTPTSDQADV